MRQQLLDQLTWEDVKEIVMVSDKLIDVDVMEGLPSCCDTEEGYYSEVLSRLREKNDCRPPCSERYQLLLSKAEEAVGRKLTSERSSDNTLIRSFVAYQMRKDGYSNSEIGRKMGRDHSSVTHLVRKFNDMLSVPAAYASEMEMFRDFEESIVNPDQE